MFHFVLLQFRKVPTIIDIGDPSSDEVETEEKRKINHPRPQGPLLRRLQNLSVDMTLNVFQLHFLPIYLQYSFMLRCLSVQKSQLHSLLQGAFPHLGIASLFTLGIPFTRRTLTRSSFPLAFSKCRSVESIKPSFSHSPPPPPPPPSFLYSDSAMHWLCSSFSLCSSHSSCAF
jgi:hypothetical protein